MDPERMADRQVAAMKERLKLTDDQETKVKPILVDSMKKQMEMRQKFGLQQGQRPSQEAMAEMKKAREDTNKKLGEVLSKEQMEEYHEDVERTSRAGRTRRAGRAPSATVTAMRLAGPAPASRDIPLHRPDARLPGVGRQHHRVEQLFRQLVLQTPGVGIVPQVPEFVGSFSRSYSSPDGCPW